MKKNKIFYSVATAAATLVMTAAPMVSTFAADNTISKQSDATFEVTEKTTTKPDVPPTDLPDTDKTDDGALQLVAVPSFDFGSVSTIDLMVGKTAIPAAGVAQNPMVNGAAATDAGANNADQHLTVSDLRGIDTNTWDLSAKLSNFKSYDDKGKLAGTLTGTLTGTLNLVSTFEDVQADYKTNPDTNKAYTQAYLTNHDFSNLNKSLTTTDGPDTTDLFTATGTTDNPGRGINVAKLNKSTLDLKANPAAKSGHYTATIDWTLTSASIADVAGSGSTNGN